MKKVEEEVSSSNPFGIERAPEISYIISATQRSGSNFLCDVLRNTGIAGSPDEYFVYWDWAVHDPDRLKNDIFKPWLVPHHAYISKLLREGTTPNGVFGVKIMWNYLDTVIENLRTFPEYRELSAPEVFEAVFPNLSYIHITRKDKIRQAVSMAKAMQSNRWIELEQWVLDERPPFFEKHIDWVEFNRKNVRETRLEYDFNQIARFYEVFREQDEAWETYFKESNINPFMVTYESFVDGYETTALEILEFLKIEKPDELVLQRCALKRQNDSINKEWAQRFEEELIDRSS